jgi:hypothetical protein
MVTTTGNRGVVCATDDTSSRIEELQFTLGEGPCLDVVSSRSPVLVPDLLSSEDFVAGRWPGFLEGAAAAGVRAVFAFPLSIGAIDVGVLDLYRDAPGDLDAGRFRMALAAADCAALALLDRDAAGGTAFADDAESRAAYRFEVHQATGMVQVQLGVTTAEAFLMLRARAFATGRSVSDLAVDVVDRLIRFSPEDA